MSDTTITCPLEMFDVMRDQIKAFNATEVELKKQLTEAKLNAVGKDGAGEFLMSAIRTAMKVMGFAVGNLHHHTVRGWPHQELAIFSEMMRKFPDVKPDDVQTADTWMAFAKEAAATDVARELNIHHDLALIPLSSMGVPGSYEAQVKKMVSDRAAVAQRKEEKQADDDGQQEQQA